MWEHRDQRGAAIGESVGDFPPGTALTSWVALQGCSLLRSWSMAERTGSKKANPIYLIDSGSVELDSLSSS